MGLDVKLLNKNKHSALHKAAVKGKRDICEWLLSTEVGLGAFHLQVYKLLCIIFICMPRVFLGVALLIFSKKDADGNSPATMARMEGYVELADYLQEKEIQYAEKIR